MEEQRLLAKSRIHGWAGWQTLQYVDAAEEADFVANDFKSSRDTILLLNFLILGSGPLVDGMISRENPARRRIIHLVMVCYVVQALARGASDRVADQHFAARIFGWVAYAITLIEWLCILYVDRCTSYIPYDDHENASMLVLTICVAFIQGLIVCTATGYCAARCAAQGLSYVLVVSAVISQHVPTARLLLTEIEFIGVFLLIVVICHAMVIAQMQ